MVGHENAKPPYLRTQGSTTQLIVNNKPLLIVGGKQHVAHGDDHAAIGLFGSQISQLGFKLSVARLVQICAALATFASSSSIHSRSIERRITLDRQRYRGMHRCGLFAGTHL